MRLALALLVVSIVCSGALQGCRSVDPFYERPLVESTVLDAQESARGTVYYLPKRLIQVVIKEKQTGPTEVAVNLQPAVADTSVRLEARLRHSVWGESKLKIGTTANGLLASVASSEVDQTGKVLEALADTAITAAKVAAGFPAAQVAPAGQDREYQFLVDPPSSAQTYTGIGGSSYNLTVEPIGTPCTTTSSCLPAQGQTFPGVVYRRSIPYQIKVLSGSAVVSDQLVSLPNHGPIGFAALKGSSFVTTNYDLRFEQGSLTSSDATRPSEALGAVQVPQNIVKSLVSLPTDLVQLKINTVGKEKELLEAQQALIKAQRALEEERQKNANTDPI